MVKTFHWLRLIPKHLTGQEVPSCESRASRELSRRGVWETERDLLAGKRSNFDKSWAQLQQSVADRRFQRRHYLGIEPRNRQRTDAFDGKL